MSQLFSSPIVSSSDVLGCLFLATGSFWIELTNSGAISNGTEKTSVSSCDMGERMFFEIGSAATLRSRIIGTDDSGGGKTAFVRVSGKTKVNKASS